MSVGPEEGTYKVYSSSITLLFVFRDAKSHAAQSTLPDGTEGKTGGKGYGELTATPKRRARTTTSFISRPPLSIGPAVYEEILGLIEESSCGSQGVYAVAWGEGLVRHEERVAKVWQRRLFSVSWGVWWTISMSCEKKKRS